MPESMNLSISSIFITIVIAIGNIGAFVYLLKWLLGKVDKHNELLPKISAQLEANTESQKIISSNMIELFNSRNNLNERVVVIEATIKHNGCDVGGRRSTDRH